MAVFPIRTFGDPVLRTRAVEVDVVDNSVRSLVADMIETMYDAPGVGLAAPQIGMSRRVFVFDAGFGAHAVINPEPVEVNAANAAASVVPFALDPDADPDWEFDEGCLSVPGYYWPITRPALFGVRGMNELGEEVVHLGDELLGRVLQHELDHLNGMLLVGRLPDRTRRKALRELSKDALGL